MIRRLRVPGFAAAAFAILASAPPVVIAAGDERPVAALSRIGHIVLTSTPVVIVGETAGDAISDFAMLSPVPIVWAAGATYKAIDISIDVSTAAVEQEDAWLHGELHLLDGDAKKLKDIKAAGGDLNGPQAQAIKTALAERAYKMTSAQRGTFNYTTNVVIKNLPYAVGRVGFGKVFENALGRATVLIGAGASIRKPVAKKINWYLNYQGPLAKRLKAAGWGKLGTRARQAEKAALEAMRDQQGKMAAEILKGNREEDLRHLAGDVFARAYRRISMENPSNPVAAPMYRLAVAREAVMMPAPAVAEASMYPAPVVAIRARPDPVVRAIDADDASNWVKERYANPTPQEERTVSGAPPAPAQDDSQAEARRDRYREALKRVGDGKTFTICSNGCPGTAESSWDGRRNQNLKSK